MISIFFLSLQNALNDKQFPKEDEVKTFVKNFLSSKPDEFWSRVINKVSGKWQEVIQNKNVVRVFINKLQKLRKGNCL